MNTEVIENTEAVVQASPATVAGVIGVAAIFFFIALLILATKNRFKRRIMGVCIGTAIVTGFIFYGWGYVETYPNSPAEAMLRTLFGVCKMFGGSNDYDTIEKATIFIQHSWTIPVFWAVHFMAFYVTASTAIATIGGRMLRRIRIARLRLGTLLIVYGVNANSLEYARRQIHVLHRTVVFIGQCDNSLESAVDGIGGVIEQNGEHPDGALLNRLGIRPGKRRIEIAALHEDGVRNIVFAQALLDAFAQAGIHPEQTALLALGMNEDQARRMIARKGCYGYGNIMCFDEYDLAARLMIQKLPPCETIRFDENARALDDFNVLMIGFGRMGRAALRHLLMHGQFFGSAFRADIFDTKAQNGMLHNHEIFKHYDVRFHAADGKSEKLYAFLEERAHALRYVVLSTGSEKENRDLAQDISHWMQEHGYAPDIAQCTGRGLVITVTGMENPRYHPIYGSDVLDIDRIDRMAMAVNHTYCSKPENTPLENWKDCDYFSRMSSRASADFYPAVLKAAGKTFEQACGGDWNPSGEMLENLSITEHLRWCAFHYVMGFKQMSDEEFARRTAIYRKNLQETGTAGINIRKDLTGRTHACLIPWEDLDALSERENAITGGRINHKQTDRNNILALPNILNAMKDYSE